MCTGYGQLLQLALVHQNFSMLPVVVWCHYGGTKIMMMMMKKYISSFVCRYFQLVSDFWKKFSNGFVNCVLAATIPKVVSTCLTGNPTNRFIEFSYLVPGRQNSSEVEEL